MPSAIVETRSAQVGQDALCRLPVGCVVHGPHRVRVALHGRNGATRSLTGLKRNASNFTGRAVPAQRLADRGLAGSQPVLIKLQSEGRCEKSRRPHIKDVMAEPTTARLEGVLLGRRDVPLDSDLLRWGEIPVSSYLLAGSLSVSG